MQRETRVSNDKQQKQEVVAKFPFKFRRMSFVASFCNFRFDEPFIFLTIKKIKFEGSKGDWSVNANDIEKESTWLTARLL